MIALNTLAIYFAMSMHQIIIVALGVPYFLYRSGDFYGERLEFFPVAFHLLYFAVFTTVYCCRCDLEHRIASNAHHFNRHLLYKYIIRTTSHDEKSSGRFGRCKVLWTVQV